MLIRISGPVVVTDDATDEPITDPKRLKTFDGIRYDEDLITNYIYDAALETADLTGGDVALVYDPKAKRLRVVSEFRAPKPLTKAQLAAMLKETTGQWSDGIGEGCFDDLQDERKVTIDLYPGSDVPEEPTAEQIDDGVATKRRVFSRLPKAAGEGDLDAVEKLLARGESANARDKHGMSGLDRAARAGHPEIVRRLIAAGADVNAPMVDPDMESRPLDAACICSRPETEATSVEIARALLDAGAAVDSRDDRGATPLMWACSRNCPALVKLLLDRGADPNARDATDDWNGGKTALMYAGTTSVIDLLLAAGADPSIRGFDGLDAIEYHKGQANEDGDPAGPTVSELAEHIRANAGKKRGKRK
jgi:hypothetical protein